MDAIISGRAGVALLVEGEVLSSFDVEDPATLLPRRPADLRMLFGEAPDIQFFEDVDQAEAARRLERAFNCASALDLVLILFDSKFLTGDVRDDAANELERLLSDTAVVEYLENILFGRPLPIAADIEGALARCAGGKLPRLLSTLEILEGYQPSIRAVCAAWDALSPELFGDDEQKAEFQRVAVREGLFRHLAVEVANGPRAHINDFILRSGLNPSITSLRNHREVLRQWISSFRQRAAAPSVRREVEDFLEESSQMRERRHGRRRRKSAEAELNKLQGQLDLIIAAMRRRDFAFAGKITDEVVNYQLENARPIHVAKTLCNLATEAKALGIHSLQLELTTRATGIAPDDGWSWAQYADALLNLQRPAEALKAYEQAEAFGSGVVARTGRAETLRALGRLSEALDAYDSAIADHPQDVVAKTGRAETLRALGRLSEALVAYDSAIADHPENVFTKTGRAETLRALGRLSEALDAYDSAIADHPENVVARSGRAETLRALGRLSEALVAYDSTIADHPENVVARNGRSCVLLALRRYEEALQGLPHENPVTRQDWIGYHLRGMILLRTGKVDEAVRIFERGTREDPIPSSKEYFRSALALAYLRQRDFAKTLRVLDDVTAPLLQPQANVLRFHAYGASNDAERAAASYEKLRDKPWPIPDDLVDELHRKNILKLEPRHDDEWVLDKEIDMNIFDANQQAMSYALLAAQQAMSYALLAA